MTISYIKRFINLLFLLIFGIFARGQSDLIGYWEPEIAFNYSVTNNYRHNFAIRKRSFIYSEDQPELRLRQIDISHFSNWKLNADESVGGGILYRFRDGFDGGSNELRLTQQYNYAVRPAIIRFGHRLRTEQRILTTGTIYRFRYRFAIDFPLNGEKTDIGEAYLSVSTELLLSISNGARAVCDHRINAILGWLLSEKMRVQTGVEYRSENFTSNTKPVVFLLSSIIFSF